MWIAAPTFIRIRVSRAKAAINWDRAIAENLTGEWLPCQKSSATQWPAQSNYRLKAEDFLKLQNPSNSIWFRAFDRCPLYPQKRTFVSAAVMSALCQKRTSIIFQSAVVCRVKQERPITGASIVADESEQPSFADQK